MSEYKDAWNIESAGAHGGIIGDLIYLESRTLHNLIFDYYQDDRGAYGSETATTCRMALQSARKSISSQINTRQTKGEDEQISSPSLWLKTNRQEQYKP